MLPKKRRSNYLAQKTLFLVVSEGRNSEPEYFGEILGAFVSERVFVKCLPAENGSSPDKVVSRLARYRGPLRKTDELWAVVDRDQWTSEQLQALFEWANQGPAHPRRGAVVNSPMFEFWLLLHFQNVDPHASPGAILSALKRHLPDYSKKKGALVACSAVFSLEIVGAAIDRAKASCPGGRPDFRGNSSNAWLLAESLLDAGGCLRSHPEISPGQ